MHVRCVLLALVIVAAPVRAADKLKPEEVIAHHLDAVGTPEARTAGRNLEGAVAMTAPASGGVAGSLNGRFRFDSESLRFALRMKFPSEGYPAEGLSLEGGQPAIDFVRPGKRSGMGNFLSAHDVILRESLLGGILNAGWPLFGVAQRGSKVGYDGLKKLGGRELHRLRYRAKKGQHELEVFLFFDPDSFRHMASVYKASQAQALGETIERSSSEPDIYLQIEETFDDFKKAKGLSLPTAWTIRYELQGKTTEYWKYDMVVETLEK
jgi:hypothetical protein